MSSRGLCVHLPVGARTSRPASSVEALGQPRAPTGSSCARPVQTTVGSGHRVARVDCLGDVVPVLETASCDQVQHECVNVVLVRLHALQLGREGPERVGLDCQWDCLAAS